MSRPTLPTTLPATLLALALLLPACSTHQSGKTNPMIRASYAGAELLMEQLPHPLPQDAPLIVATFVDINRLTESSTLGRMMAEQVSARLTQLQVPVVELKLRGSAFVKEGKGELLLSREIRDLSLEHKVQAVVVGTYAIGAERLYLNLKLVRPTDNRILAAQDMAVDLDETTWVLLMRDDHAGK